MHSRFAILAGSIGLAVPLSVAAQSINVDFGGGASTPAATYGAAGAAGTWNSIGVLDPFVRVPLVNADGSSTGVELYMFGGTQLLEFDVPETAGDDAALMDDMLIGFNDPVDVCIWVTGLVNDAYEVLTYALTPGDPSNLSPARVDFATPGPMDVGGSWPGIHVEQTTFARHTLTITNGRIALHSGTYNAGPFQSGINGIQIRSRSAAGTFPEGLGTRFLGAYPNPAFAAQSLSFVLAERVSGSLEIVDVAGRIVWRHPLDALTAGPHALNWTGVDARGQRLPAAVYFVRLRDSAGHLAGSHKLLRVD
jgi:hypothetical protein